MKFRGQQPATLYKCVNVQVLQIGQFKSVEINYEGNSPFQVGTRQ